MTDWFSGDGARKGHDLAREQAEQATDAADGEILADGEADRVRCDHCGERFDRDEAAGAFFDGDVARYRCPECGHATEGPPPG